MLSSLVVVVVVVFVSILFPMRPRRTPITINFSLDNVVIVVVVVVIVH